ncbi:type I-E CRISPR-associated protein Cas6/Cse3/CasE [uncultured Psychrobacter sp.]|uniref:type I-E CRISPR-associated protein Cas6/Cse3/CasE n=1 Tax=uncultured Psychrobacter sp. TaxID=259303 RepID=UPI0030D8BC99
MTTQNNTTQKATTHSFAITLTEPLDKKNIHDQLYEALAKTDGDWYQPAENETRRIQFVKKSEFLVCRSTHKPTSAISLEKSIEVSNGDHLRLEVRLPGSKRTLEGDPRGKGKTVPLLPDEKTPFFTDLLSKNGMGVLSLTHKYSPGNDIAFKSSVNVVIDTCDVTAMIEVTDAEKFMNAYLYGVGRYKTYGCGMLNVTKL